jgi:polyisoprenoid-binding protein YceI
LKKTNAKNYKLSGDLTMHGVTKPVVLDLVFVGKVINPMSKKEIIVFNVKGILKRSDFAIGSKFPAAMVGDEVTLVASAELSPAQ